MNLYLRLLLVFFAALRAKKVKTREETRRRFRVFPTDIDLYGHMNNGRYFQIMDVARFYWLLRTGTIKVLQTHGWSALLGGGMMRFQKSLKLFESYSVTTRLLCWDKSWFYLQHRFLNSKGKLIAVGVVKAAFRSRNGWVRTADAMQLIDPEAVRPPMAPSIRLWQQSETDIWSLDRRSCDIRRDRDLEGPAESDVSLFDPVSVKNDGNSEIIER